MLLLCVFFALVSLYKAYEFRVEEEKKIFILVVLLTFFLVYGKSTVTS